jgi:putative membrane protein
VKTDLGIFLRGMLMGAADVVPGVSGGTMALITGIYHTLLSSISRIDLEALRLLVSGDWRAAWVRINGRFLVVLGSGIAISIVSLAQGILWALEHYPLPLWSFFFGLIAASAWWLLRQLNRISALMIALLLCAALAAGSLVLWVPSSVEVQSGSLLLVLLGMYEPVLQALRQFDIGSVGLFCVGAGAGLMTFSRILNYFLTTHLSATLAVLTGFLWGSLVMVWPWRVATESFVLVSPDRFAQLSGSPMILECLISCAVGLILVFLVQSRWGHDSAGS